MPDTPVPTYSELHPTPISSTIATLARRIQERFPTADQQNQQGQAATVSTPDKETAG